jgi:hypothetical protein
MVDVQVFPPSDYGRERMVQPAQDGAWVADFSVPGPESWEQELFDLQRDLHAQICQWDDGDGDTTCTHWWLPPASTVDTPPGPEVVVTPAPDTSITFAEVTGSGETTLAIDPGQIAAPPANFAVLNTSYEISTTAVFSEAQVCLSYDETGLTLEQEQALRLLHFEDPAWVDVTDGGYPDTANNRICGTVTSFSPFVIAYPLNEPPVNQPPVITQVTGPIIPVEVGHEITAEATFSDPDVGDTHSVQWDWGDGYSTFASATPPTASASHTYTTPGVYTVTATVRDAALEASTAPFEYVVVYDPDGGFVTGGGWITSPAGAYTADPALTGKATFGFVSKYARGANVPSGNTEFQFRTASFNFSSTSYQWLVVAGAKAQYKGSGTINGSGDYAFILTAVDGQVTGGGGTDRFRIKIWDKATGQVVYDNMLSAADSANPTTIIDGGSITVHRGR